MATIGLDRLYYAKITEDESGDETYGTPNSLAKAISADLSVEMNEATLYADDGEAEVVKEFKSGKLTLGIDDIGTSVANELTGAKIDKNHVRVFDNRYAPQSVDGFCNANDYWKFFFSANIQYGRLCYCRPVCWFFRTCSCRCMCSIEMCSFVWHWEPVSEPVCL